MKPTRKVSLNDGFLDIFYPFYYINTILCVRKYNIYGNFVENITRKNILWAILINCLVTCFYGLVMTFTYFGQPFKWAYYLIYFQYAFNFAAVCFINLYFSGKSLRLLVILNELNKNLYRNSKDMRKMKIFTWLSIVFILSNCIALVLFKVAIDMNWSFMRGIFVSISALLDIEILQIMITINMLSYQTQMWTSIIKNTQFEKVNDDEITVDNETALEEMNKALESVTEAWSLIQNSSGFIIVCHYITTFIQSLFYAEIVILWSTTHFGQEYMILSHVIGMVLLLSKAFFVETQLCVACEKFYEEVTRAHTNVIFKLSQNLRSKRMWKNMLRVIQGDFEKFSACGLFVVDAATLLHFCNLVTTYIIVLLQFAIL